MNLVAFLHGWPVLEPLVLDAWDRGVHRRGAVFESQARRMRGGMTSSARGEDDIAQAATMPEDGVEPPDALRRRMAGIGEDGRKYEVLAARRGVMMRDGVYGAGGAGGDSIAGMLVGFVVELILTALVNAVLEGAAEDRPWKVKVYRYRGPLARRIHSEVLPRHVQDPEPRMGLLLDQHGPASPPLA